MLIDKLVLTKTPTPPTPLLPHVPRNSSSPASKTALKGWRLLASARPMTSCVILLACMGKSSIEDSDASCSVNPIWLDSSEKRVDDSLQADWAIVAEMLEIALLEQ
ncbi:unnamed protein product [Angiostrongylus costaricensis]|uniref:Uncharacterized protein n=1 Tax=Angiostrongylus costaricensis TaxID=334426 RepID=A0A0R3PWT6_ANGCS|nr:unnamed protein product [Angiostrongylus costaricensis]